ncbi:protein-export membrane protein SecD [Intrasporangium chromatireducens Q5-1]|uniref:Protein translocase subunit SecD n=1 Tax=Intrasporangium chromatireducens Q5-1 TaxID=584657 RepID=W9GS88_9MICO|nr:protein translocase subunit SecD [Intrasporangium chromatireducens]EWT06754.1 protein-export membrane protein SecD [Intrasporangium chromatireducens Q5-1]
MARSSEKRSATRSLTALIAIIIGLLAIAAGLAQWGGGQYTPRLGLDLEGGTEIVLEPVLVGNTTVTAGQINQAVDIIRQRIDANGVSEAEISTLGGRNIDIAIPGTPTAEQLDAIRKPSQLRFRAVFVQTANIPTAAPAPTPAPSATGTATPSGTSSATATGAPSGTPSASKTAANAPVPSALRAATSSPTTSASGSTATGGATGTATSTPTAPAEQAPPSNPEDEKTVAAETSQSLVALGWDKAKADAAAATVAKQFVALNCSVPGTLDKIVDDPALPMATCSDDQTSKFVLGPVEIDGSEISDASSGFQAGPNGQPTSIVEVRLSFNSAGAKKFAQVTQRLYALQSQPPRDQFAVVLDKAVITAPRAQAVITNGQASITGSFTVDSAKQLAQQLKFGALPLSFKLQTQDDITPQLGQEQLTLGLLAGLIGLILVVIYSLFQYRALAFVTVLSLVVAAVLTYLAVTVLGTTHGFRLTMAGVTGLIVAIGVTADSFIVYFERIRDEVREGRPLVAAVETGWKRAKRTIIAADAVNFIAAVVLYLLASANVRGFAFTLGLTTIIDLLVVMLFTHPMVQLLARTEFFGNGHRWSGLDPVRLGAKVSPRYRGAGQFGTGPRTASRSASRSAAASRLGSAEGRGQA